MKHSETHPGIGLSAGAEVRIVDPVSLTASYNLLQSTSADLGGWKTDILYHGPIAGLRVTF